MVPLPDCASGEWGPTKATRLFGLIPITHQVISLKSSHDECKFELIYFSFSVNFKGPLIFAGRMTELQFRMSRPLTDFMATLHKNGIEEKKLSKYVAHTILDDIVTFSIKYVPFMHHCIG